MTLVFAGLMLSKMEWSDGMIHSIKAGFHTGGTSPILALELADSLPELEGVLPETPDGEKDRLMAIIQVAADYPLGLFLLLTCLGYLELARTRTDVLPSVLRCLMGLLFLCGGLTGLAWGFGKNSGLLIENAMAFMAAALLLLPFLVWKPDAPWR
ncbi:MAG: hypothetical protein NTV80_07600 [Verrucomicrobia bacterium]|nr:hypothetical protein [Verrucomicrobiota bacterium]